MFNETAARLTFLKRADGSSEFRCGKTIVWCAVNGPGDIQSSKRLYDRVNLVFSFNKIPPKNKIELTKPPQRDKKDKTEGVFNRFITSIITNAIQIYSYPRTALQICTQEIKIDSASLSATINAICLALLDSGIRLNYIFAAVAVAKVGKEFVVEPDGLQLIGATTIFTFVFKSSMTEVGGNLIANEIHGYFSLDDYEIALELARKETLNLFDLYREKITGKFGCCLLTTQESSSFKC